MEYLTTVSITIHFLLCQYSTVVNRSTWHFNFPQSLSIVITGHFVDYLEPIRHAFREKRFTVREVSYDASKAGGVDGAIQQGEAEMTQVRNAALRWCRAHFGEVYSGWMHLKVIQAFVESVLRYGLPVDFLTFLLEPNMKVEKEVRARLTKTVLQMRPELQMKKLMLADEEEEGADESDSLPYVLLKFPIIGNTATSSS